MSKVQLHNHGLCGCHFFVYLQHKDHNILRVTHVHSSFIWDEERGKRMLPDTDLSLSPQTWVSEGSRFWEETQMCYKQPRAFQKVRKTIRRAFGGGRTGGRAGGQAEYSWHIRSPQPEQTCLIGPYPGKTRECQCPMLTTNQYMTFTLSFFFFSFLFSFFFFTL